MNEVRCRRCKEKIPEGKFACPRCVNALSDRAYLEHQLKFLPTILANQCEIHLVYIASGRSGEIEPYWHLQRIDDKSHGYCSAELKTGNRQDHIRYYQLRETKHLCPRCIEALDKLIASLPAEQLPPLAATTGPLPTTLSPSEWAPY